MQQGAGVAISFPRHTALLLSAYREVSFYQTFLFLVVFKRKGQSMDSIFLNKEKW